MDLFTNPAAAVFGKDSFPAQIHKMAVDPAGVIDETKIDGIPAGLRDPYGIGDKGRPVAQDAPYDSSGATLAAANKKKAAAQASLDAQWKSSAGGPSPSYSLTSPLVSGSTSTLKSKLG
jgi:hypothetical protein